MAYTVEIKDVATGDTVTRAFDYEWDQKGDLYWWTDGNFGCDLNRSMEFWRGKGASEDEVRQRTAGVQCSNATGTQAYLVRITLPDGTVVLDEFTNEEEG